MHFHCKNLSVHLRRNRGGTLIIVTTNLRFGDWVSIFGDKTMTSALLDRLTGKGHILEFIGESYRFRQRLRQEEQLSAEGKAETG
jgi:DNA replication protein DnaC